MRGSNKAKLIAAEIWQIRCDHIKHLEGKGFTKYDANHRAWVVMTEYAKAMIHAQPQNVHDVVEALKFLTQVLEKACMFGHDLDLNSGKS